MISMGPALDLDRLKTTFTSLITQAEPNVLPAFMLWVDLKVSEFKVNSKPPTNYKSGSKDAQPNQNQWNQIELKRSSFKEQCNNLNTRDTVCGRQSHSPVMDRAQCYVPPSDTPMNLVKDLSMKNKRADDDRNMSGVSSPPEHSPKKSLKSIIDHIVKKETLSDRIHPLDLHNHMQLPVATPFMPPAVALAHSHFNIAKLLARGPPVMPPQLADIPESRPVKHPLPMPKMEMSPKRFCNEVPPEQAMCLKKQMPQVPPVIEEGSYFPQLLAIKPESPRKEQEHYCEKENNTFRAEPPSKSRVASALRELLTSKISSQYCNRDEAASPEPEKLVIDEDRISDCPDMDSEIPRSPMSEEDLTDQGKHPNKCPVCSQMFQYRSSFRRHMKVHQGIFSHVCAVCARKFTRKEHFVRHKCSRKPNKASRGAHTDISGTGIATPKVEFPPIQSSPDYRSEASMDGSHSEFSDYPCSPIKMSHVPESRRKAAVPRKVVLLDESERAEESFEEERQAPEFDEERIGCISPKTCPSVMDQSLEQTPSPSKSDRSLSPGRCTPDMYYSPRKDCISQSFSEECDEALDLSCPQAPLPASPHTLYDEDAPLNLTGTVPQSLTSQQEFTINTGSYKVVTSAGPEPEGKERGNQYIKVVKQGNYLRLKEEAQVIAGQLCFVCPTCGKIFHRSSNFSRHMRIHRGVYSYVCPSCQRGFFRREHFQKHKCSRRGMSHTWDRKTKIDMVLAANGGQEGSDVEGLEGGSDVADSEESYPLSGCEIAEEQLTPQEEEAVVDGQEA